MTYTTSSDRIALIAEHHPASAKNFGTSGLIKTLCASPRRPFQAVVATDLAGSKPVAGPWEELPILSLFRPRSLLPKIGLGLLDNFFFCQAERAGLSFSSAPPDQPALHLIS